MSKAPQVSSSKTVNLDLDNEDEFEEFQEDNWTPSKDNFELWDENWDEMNTVDEDLEKFLNLRKPNNYLYNIMKIFQ
ncbi:hypothetical protein BLOT_014477 [Blomia tropicalis]|nr:hypothetical protein BLOT_014477 [Blomia tropicalis]